MEEKVHTYIFVEKKNGEGKGGVYLRKENIFFVEVLEGCHRVLERGAPPDDHL